MLIMRVEDRLIRKRLECMNSVKVLFCFNKIVFLLLLTLVCQLYGLKAQNIDSLIKVVQNQEDTLKCITYINILNYYNNSEPIKALRFAYPALKHAEKTGVEKFITTTNSRIGITYYLIGNSTRAIEIFLQVLKIYEENRDSLNIAKTLNNIGLTYLQVKDYNKALSFYKRSLNIKKKFNDKETIWTTYLNIGLACNELKDYSEGLKNFYQALNSWENLKKKDDENYASIMSEIGRTYLLMDSLDKSETLLMEANNLLEKSGNVYRSARIFVTLAQVKRKKGEYTQARYFGLRSIQLAMQSGSLDILTDSYLEMSQIEESHNRKDQALKYLKLYISFKDSIEQVSNLLEMNQYQEMYLIQKQEEEKLVLKKEIDLNKAKLQMNRIIILAILILFFLVLAFSVYLIRNIKHRKTTNEKLFEQQIRINQSVEELKKQKEELTDLNSTKDKFFSIIAHDLKNPLGSIVGISDLLNTDFDTFDVSKQKKFVQLINQASNDLFKLLENLLQWSRIQTGSIPYDPKIVLLSDIVQPVISLLEPSARNKNITITNLIPPSIVVLADVSMISTVLRNLIGNAVKFTNLNGNVILNAEDTGQLVKVKVSDDGVGLTENDLLSIFKTDAKFTKRGTSDEKGTGLGLIVCKEFIEKIMVGLGP